MRHAVVEVLRNRVPDVVRELGPRAEPRRLPQRLPRLPPRACSKRSRSSATRDDFVFDTQFLVQAVHFGFRLGDVPVPVRYFAEASSINFQAVDDVRPADALDDGPVLAAPDAHVALGAVPEEVIKVGHIQACPGRLPSASPADSRPAPLPCTHPSTRSTLLRPRRKITGMSAILLPVRPPRADRLGRVPRPTSTAPSPPACPGRQHGHRVRQPAHPGREAAGARRDAGPGRRPDVRRRGVRRRSRRAPPSTWTPTAGPSTRSATPAARPVIFQSYGLTALDGERVLDAYRAIAKHCRRFIGFELGTMFAPFGRIYDLDTYAGLLGDPGVRRGQALVARPRAGMATAAACATSGGRTSWC